MNSTKSYCEWKYYNQFDLADLFNEIRKQINPDITKLEKEFQYLFYKILHTEPCIYWDKAVYTQTISLLENLFQTHYQTLEIDDFVFNCFLMGSNAYGEISETISDLRDFNLSQEIKTRLYRLPAYTTIVESCLSNFLRVIAIVTGRCIGKDYTTQNTLGQLINIINSAGYVEIANKVNVNIRNAINHGKMQLKKKFLNVYVFIMMKIIFQHLWRCHSINLIRL